MIWGCWEHEEAGTWWVRVSSGANQVFTPAAGNKIRRYGVKTMWKITMVAGKNGGSDGKESARMQETWVRSLGWEDPLERKMVTLSSNPMDRGSWLGVGHYSPWYRKELDTTERLTFIHVCWPLVIRICSS